MNINGISIHTSHWEQTPESWSAASVEASQMLSVLSGSFGWAGSRARAATSASASFRCGRAGAERSSGKKMLWLNNLQVIYERMVQSHETSCTASPPQGRNMLHFMAVCSSPAPDCYPGAPTLGTYEAPRDLVVHADPGPIPRASESVGRGGSPEL